MFAFSLVEILLETLFSVAETVMESPLILLVPAVLFAMLSFKFPQKKMAIGFFTALHLVFLPVWGIWLYGSYILQITSCPSKWSLPVVIPSLLWPVVVYLSFHLFLKETKYNRLKALATVFIGFGVCFFLSWTLTLIVMPEVNSAEYVEHMRCSSFGV